VTYKNIIIIGAGASGLMLGSHLHNQEFIILEQNSKIAQKLKVCGGGKCNITNKQVSEDNYLGNKQFVKSILDDFGKQELLEFLNHNGLKPVVREEKYYFCPNSSDEAIDIFRKKVDKKNIFLNTQVTNVEKQNDNYVITTNKQKFSCKHLVVCSGGISYPKIGTSDIAYNIAQTFGHTVTKLNPALVGFTVQKEQFWFKNLSGVTVKAKVTVGEKSFIDNVLFTHKGVSGPAILSASVYWEKGSLSIDFLPDIDIKKNLNSSNKLISNALPLPKRFVQEFLKSSDIKDKPLQTLTKDEKQKLALLKNYTLCPAGTFGFNKAEVTKGGICTDEIDKQTLMSKKTKNLYFLGECLNVTGELGGYNLQFAFSSGYICSKNWNKCV
jgi:predicted Rossmann fold flavoprotein